MTTTTTDAAVHNFGMFRHGGVTGLTTSLRRRPLLVKFVNEVLKRALPEDATYTTFSINYNTPLAVHADLHNDPEARNYVLGCGDYAGGDIWVALQDGEEAQLPTAWKQFNGRWLRGQLHSIYHKPASFSPTRPHSPTAWDGFRVSVAAYTVGRHQAAAGPTRQCLEGLGFPVPKIVRAQHEGGDAEDEDSCGLQKVAKIADTSQDHGDSQRSCRPVLRQRGSSETASFGRSNGVSNLDSGGSEFFVRKCKGFEMDPSLCVCRASPQHFYIGDFAPSSEAEAEGSDLLGSGGVRHACELHGDSLRALRHPGPGGVEHACELPGDSLRALRHPGPGGVEHACELPGDSLRALRLPGPGGVEHARELPGDSLRALRHPGPGGVEHACEFRGDSVRALRHPGPGGDGQNGVEFGEEGSFGGYAIEAAIRHLALVGTGDDNVHWEMVASEDELRMCNDEESQGLEQLRIYLLMVENEERDALALEIEAGDDLGTPARLRRLGEQVSELERALESVERFFDDGGHHRGGWDRIASAKEEEEEAPLHTKMVPLEEVRKNLAVWIPSMTSEYQSLTLENSAVSPFSQEELEAWDKEGKEYDLVPGKTVHSKKAFSGRLKTRAVVCGNYIADSYSKEEKFASGADGVLVRCCLRVCARRAWDLGRTAFLLAPLLYREARPTIVRVPKVFLEAKICEERFWRVDRAMYGLCTSPKSWSSYRDTTMRP